MHTLTTSIGLLVLRLGFGAYLMSHGWLKLEMLFKGDFDTLGDPIGLGKGLSLVLIVLAEVFCSALVMLGLATRLAAVPIVFSMAVAAFVVHRNDPWTMGAGASKEPALLFLIPFLALIFTGAGKISFDNLIVPRWRSWRAKKQAASAS